MEKRRVERERVPSWPGFGLHDTLRAADISNVFASLYLVHKWLISLLRFVAFEGFFFIFFFTFSSFFQQSEFRQ